MQTAGCLLPFKSGDQFFGLLEKRIVVTAVDMTRVDQLIGFVTHECGCSLYRRHDGACCRIKTATTMGQQAVEVKAMGNGGRFRHGRAP